MNPFKQLPCIIALVLAGTGLSMAQEATPDSGLQSASLRSRAEVQAELVRARASGELAVFSAGYLPRIDTQRSRAEVMAELQRARANGEAQHINAEVGALAFSTGRFADPVLAQQR